MTMHPPLLLSGYVTTCSAVTGRSHSELEDVLGFARGALSFGLHVYQLSDPIGPDDFVWKDRTRYSDGWRFDSSIGEYVQRTDELRAHLGKRLGYSEVAVDESLASFRTAQLEKLNIRSGPNRIVKIVPNVKPSSFPDSGFCNIPQWRLIKKKQFIFIGTTL